MFKKSDLTLENICIAIKLLLILAVYANHAA